MDASRLLLLLPALSCACAGAERIPDTAPNDCHDGGEDPDPTSPEVCNDGVDDHCDDAWSECRIADPVAEWDFEVATDWAYPMGLAALSVDADPELELVVTASDQGTVVLDLDLEAGRLDRALSLYSGSGAAHDVRAAGDLGGTPDADLLFTVADATGEGVTVLFPPLGEESGRLAPGSGFRVGTEARIQIEQVLGDVDLDGDGIDDLLVGDNTVDAYAGGVYAARPEPDGVVVLADLVGLSPRPAEARFGSALCSAGDVDGDGTDDLVVGAPGEGAVLLLVGGATWAEAEPAVLIAHDDDASGDGFGSRLSAGDVDGDGLPDLAIQAATAAWLVPSPLDPRATIHVDDAGGWLDLSAVGNRVGLDADLDHDGVGDAVVVDRYTPECNLALGGPDTTMAVAYGGAAFAADAWDAVGHGWCDVTAGFRLSGAWAAEDLDLDGYPELLVGFEALGTSDASSPFGFRIRRGTGR